MMGRGASRRQRARRPGPAALAVALALAGPMVAPGETAPAPALAKHRWQGRLDGRHFSATVRLTVKRGGLAEERRLDVFRDDREGRRERLMVRFREPADLRGLGLLYLENDGRPNDYFLYQPSLRRLRRIPETMARDDVYGVDLEYLGFGVALIEPTTVAEARASELDGRPVIFLREVAIRANPRFDERRVWLDPETWIPLRTEHVRDRRSAMVASTHEIRTVQGVPTPTLVVFERERGTDVTMTVEGVDYEAAIPESFFSTLALIKEQTGPLPAREAP